MAKVTWLGRAKPDDPIYKMGLVVSAQNIKRSPPATKRKPKATKRGIFCKGECS